MVISSTRLVFPFDGKTVSLNDYRLFSAADIDKLSNATGFVINITNLTTQRIRIRTLSALRSVDIQKFYMEATKAC